MRAILVFAVNGAEQQFRNTEATPEDAGRVFQYNCEVVPRDLVVLNYAEMRPLFRCSDSREGVFSGRTEFIAMARDALPPGFTRAPCPQDYGVTVFIACLRNSDGTEVRLDADTGFSTATFDILVLAPTLPQRERARVLGEAAAALAPPFEELTAIVARGFDDADVSRFATEYETMLDGCGVRRPANGRPVVACDVRDVWSFTEADFTAAVRDALPKTFRQAECVQPSELPVCERNDNNVEVHVGDFLRIEADDTHPVPRTALMRRFLDNAVEAAGRNFQGFDSDTELPYFGHQCTVEVEDNTARRYLACSLLSSVPGRGDLAFALLPVIQAALPAGYAGATTCTLDYWPTQMMSAVDCFASDRVEVDVGEGAQMQWYVYVGSSRNSRP